MRASCLAGCADTRPTAEDYDRLWPSQIEEAEGEVLLGFQDLMEAKVAHELMRNGLSAVQVRRAIELARKITGQERPLSSRTFHTDGRRLYLELLKDTGESELLDLFERQYAFPRIIAPSLRHVEFGADKQPNRWWPNGKSARILVDPAFAFGQPIDADSHVPTAALAAALKAEGSIEAVARAWHVSAASVRRSARFAARLTRRAA